MTNFWFFQNRATGFQLTGNLGANWRQTLHALGGKLTSCWQQSNYFVTFPSEMNSCAFYGNCGHIFCLHSSLVQLRCIINQLKQLTPLPVILSIQGAFLTDVEFLFKLSVMWKVGYSDWYSTFNDNVVDVCCSHNILEFFNCFKLFHFIVRPVPKLAKLCRARR